MSYDESSAPDAPSEIDADMRRAIYAQRQFVTSTRVAEFEGTSKELGFEWEASIARTLRRIRESQKLSQAQVVERLEARWGIDMHQTTLAKLEGGKRPIRLAELFALASIYGMTALTVLTLDATASPLEGEAEINKQILARGLQEQGIKSALLQTLGRGMDELALRVEERAAFANVLRVLAESEMRSQGIRPDGEHQTEG